MKSLNTPLIITAFIIPIITVIVIIELAGIIITQPYSVYVFEINYPKRVLVNEKFNITARLVLANGKVFANQTIHLQQYINGKWVTIIDIKTDDQGIFNVTLKCTRPGIYIFRLYHMSERAYLDFKFTIEVVPLSPLPLIVFIIVFTSSMIPIVIIEYKRVRRKLHYP